VPNTKRYYGIYTNILERSVEGLVFRCEKKSYVTNDVGRMGALIVLINPL
jgi:hypothetical protein